MEIKVYNSTGGLFSVFCDDDAYNNINEQNWQTTLPFASTYNTVYKAEEEVMSSQLINNLLAFLPHTVIKNFPNLESGGSADYYYPIDSSRSVKIRTRRRDWSPYNYVSDSFVVVNDNNYSYQPVWSGSGPFGNFGTSSALQLNSSISLWCIVFKNDMSAYKTFAIDITENNISISLFTSLNTNGVIEFFSGLTPIVIEEEPDDPYEEGGYSGYGGGGGSFDNNSDTIDFNNLPTLSAVDAGFITLFNPTLAELKSLANYMWANLLSWETIRKLFADPMDAILGLNIVPVAVPDGVSREIKVGGVGTGVTMTVAASQYVTVNCGSVTISEYWGSALDYSPYTKVQLFLPYIGFVQIDTDDIMGRTITIQYKVDILTGACIAQIKSVGGTHSNLGAVLYTFAGHCAQNIPVTGVNFSQLISAVIGVATTAITAGIAAGAAGAGVAAAEAALDSTVATVGEEIASGELTQAGIKAAGASIAKAKAGVARSEAIRAQTMSNAINNTVGQIMGVKPVINHSGSISAVSGMLGLQKPYFIITRPRQSLAQNYRHYVGYPSNVLSAFSDLKGFTAFEQVILEGLSATDSELAELYEILKGGVYFEFYSNPFE